MKAKAKKFVTGFGATLVFAGAAAAAVVGSQKLVIVILGKVTPATGLAGLAVVCALIVGGAYAFWPE